MDKIEELRSKAIELNQRAIGSTHKDSWDFTRSEIIEFTRKVLALIDAAGKPVEGEYRFEEPDGLKPGDSPWVDLFHGKTKLCRITASYKAETILADLLNSQGAEIKRLRLDVLDVRHKQAKRIAVINDLQTDLATAKVRVEELERDLASIEHRKCKAALEVSELKVIQLQGSVRSHEDIWTKRTLEIASLTAEVGRLREALEKSELLISSVLTVCRLSAKDLAKDAEWYKNTADNICETRDDMRQVLSVAPDVRGEGGESEV